jgi:hypothetical protein
MYGVSNRASELLFELNGFLGLQQFLAAEIRNQSDSSVFKDDFMQSSYTLHMITRDK